MDVLLLFVIPGITGFLIGYWAMPAIVGVCTIFVLVGFSALYLKKIQPVKRDLGAYQGFFMLFCGGVSALFCIGVIFSFGISVFLGSLVTLNYETPIFSNFNI